MNQIKKAKTRLLFLGIVGILSITSCEKEAENLPKKQDPVTTTLELSCDLQGLNRLVHEDSVLTLVDRGIEVDYIINCKAYVNGDFIVKPGVTIQFGTDAGIEVGTSGSIQVLGTAQDQVLFTGEDKLPGSWKGVFIDSDDVKNKIEYAKIEYAGGGNFNSNGDLGGVIVYSDTRLNMNNSTIINSKAYGFNASYGGDDLVLENNTITKCEAPMLVEGAYPTAISGGSYIGNTTDAIIVTADQITGIHNWSKLNVPYHFPEGLQVVAGGKLTIMPGVVMKFGSDSRLFINEGASGQKPSIVAVGTVQEPIVFTSIDKVLGGWRGIYFDTPAPLNEIGFATIEYASNPNQSGAIETWFGTVLNVHDVLFKDIQECAIHQYISSAFPNTLTTSNLTFENVGSSSICQN